MARQDDTSKPAGTVRLTEGRPRVAPFWARIPRGWIFVVLFFLAWLGVFLMWNGFRLLAQL